MASVFNIKSGMNELIIASNNQGKIREIRTLLEGYDLRSLKDIGFANEIPEPYETFEENALAKAREIYKYSGKNVFADDSGICVDALNGAPGVFSARYAGEPSNDEANNRKLLGALGSFADRFAYYKAVICLIFDGEPYFFEGICKGHIAQMGSGDKGFGYDPLFIPEGFTQSFGTIDPQIKNDISHRGKAIRKMVAFLKEQRDSE
jgi:XTP/dITP diphosphohydrolase